MMAGTAVRELVPKLLLRIEGHCYIYFFSKVICGSKCWEDENKKKIEWFKWRCCFRDRQGCG